MFRMANGRPSSELVSRFRGETKMVTMAWYAGTALPPALLTVVSIGVFVAGLQRLGRPVRFPWGRAIYVSWFIFFAVSPFPFAEYSGMVGISLFALGLPFWLICLVVARARTLRGDGDFEDTA